MQTNKLHGTADASIDVQAENTGHLQTDLGNDIQEEQHKTSRSARKSRQHGRHNHLETNELHWKTSLSVT